MDFNGKRVAVLDTIHGGRQICKTLRERGADASAFDIYHDPPAVDVINAFDIVVAPVHAQTTLIARAEALGTPVLTHHQAVGELARSNEKLQAARVFEVTGVKGKTTTASLLGNAYGDRRTVLLTSRGLELREKGRYLAKKRLSITPANILTAIELFTEFDFDPEVCIFEVSLGGTGLADVNVLTTLSPEYGIAQNTKTSTFAKLQMVSNAKANSCVVTSAGTTSLPKPTPCVNTFGDDGATVRYERAEEDHPKIEYTDLTRIDGTRISGEICFEFAGSYDAASYKDTLLCFATAALSASLDPEAISQTLTAFRGVIGRMTATELRGRVLIDNSNSGLDELSIARAITYGLKYKKEGQKSVLIVGAEARNVCAEIAPQAIESVAKTDGLDRIILVGDQTLGVETDVGKRFSDLESALREALALTAEQDVIISCVKMWR
jgi:UDP-N-acetylmuramyl pentapeptide synthase